MKLWIDDWREPPSGYIWLKSTREALQFITNQENSASIVLIDLDHDSGEYSRDGGDYINILKELERLSHKKITVSGLVVPGYWHSQCINYKFRLHSMNPVGVQNMRAILQRNNWVEV